jgi:hypothetical protein
MSLNNKYILTEFKKGNICKSKLKETLGDDVFKISNSKPEIITPNGAIEVIKRYQTKNLSLERLLEWVNTIWFTDLFDYQDGYDDSIASVMNHLEEMDEEGISYSSNDFSKMIAALEGNYDVVL